VAAGSLGQEDSVAAHIAEGKAMTSTKMLVLRKNFDAVICDDPKAHAEKVEALDRNQLANLIEGVEIYLPDGHGDPGGQELTAPRGVSRSR
jgi:hypothetical protein